MSDADFQEQQEQFAKVFTQVGDLVTPPRYYVMGDSHSLFFAGAEQVLDTHTVFGPIHQGGARGAYGLRPCDIPGQGGRTKFIT